MTLDDLRLNLATINNHHEAARKLIADEALKAIRELEADRDNWRKQALDKDVINGKKIDDVAQIVGELSYIFDGSNQKHKYCDDVINIYLDRLCAALEITVKAGGEKEA